MSKWLRKYPALCLEKTHFKYKRYTLRYRQVESKWMDKIYFVNIKPERAWCGYSKFGQSRLQYKEYSHKQKVSFYKDKRINSSRKHNNPKYV